NPESTQQESFKAGNTKEQILHPHISLSESDLNQTSLSINQSQENIQAGKNFKTSPLSLYGSEPNTDFKKEQVVVESTISHNPHIEVPVQIHSSWIMQAAFSSMAALQNTAFSEEQVYITSSVLAKENPFALQLHGASADFKNANLTFLALYDVSAADRFGLEAGRENFIQNFSQSVNGQTIRTTQLVPVTTLGVVYQRSLSGIISSDWLVPFAQGYLGSSAEGVILTKLSTGANIRVTGSFILMLGAEAAYAPLSKQYNSRYQLVAGAGMQF
ncbi:MAG TPA: hypothetical protein VEC36_11775, partial [Patescibacteria group bacterium]|nr:hypothetical protein [Patescibacteria group bacterium]